MHDHSSAANAIDELHDQGLIYTGDQNTIELTTRGNALADNVIASRPELSNQLYGGIPSAELATTIRVLDTIRERAITVDARRGTA